MYGVGWVSPGTSFTTLLLHPTVLVVSASIFLQGLVFPFPPTFLPSYALALSLSSYSGDAILAINSLSQVTGQILLGYLVTGLACFLLWGRAKEMARLGLFAGLWGSFAGSYSVFWTRIATGLAVQSEGATYEERDAAALKMALYSWFSFERGVADILAGPISGLLTGNEVVREGFGLGKLEKRCGLMWLWERWGRGGRWMRVQSEIS
ncbi:hypothetical protein K469DRAFT_731045 [Zopfia rhizophila CBS 207.26]|uniref:Uncharacterized protein n=1 Tax=Zopfia rhizophila CBS 207.26 TaxID=1314779 RepID=A0A6A6EN94_9PEZI|nr:hypothetical protein K469DRAFT_731045 [Zopfia rhizophila CBS 207.26]